MKKQSAPPIRTCYECRGSTTGRKESYSFAECGLKHVVLKGVMVYRCSRCGGSHVDIPNMDGLHRTIALNVLCKKGLLTSEEIKFLRKVVGLTATEFAKKLAVTKVAVSRWENGGRVGAQSDLSIRLRCGIAIIAEIVNDPMISVDDTEVSSTVVKLRKFIRDFVPESVVAGSRDHAKEAERMVIDPDFPFVISILEPLQPGNRQLLQ